MDQYFSDFLIIWSVLTKTYIAHTLGVWILAIFIVEKLEEYESSKKLRNREW